MPKRKSTHAEEPAAAAAAEPRRRSMRLQKTEDVPGPAAVSSKTGKQSVKKEKTSASDSKDEPAAKKSRSLKDMPETVAKKPSPPAKKTAKKNYWLLKAEPDTRYENGIDVKFSIDDLASRTEPEPWDGIRNYAARNNLRAMKKGDLAFFYHSNCKEPGIVGTMEIVQEHSPDLSAHDPKAPYYDPKSSASDPRWSVVHVKFNRKFPVPITLRELKEFGAAGKPLQNMQMIKQSRLSVSKVSAAEWEFLLGVVQDKAIKEYEARPPVCTGYSGTPDDDGDL
ncbi:PUA-like domain-containing protein [Triangularia verruculosa]|uniref:Thymocyte nuclear protein 1 n=1 Tax=Triangularia verruculosa TaxID=2587418 RepID=A0AAN6XCY3_9PEZI|nr:PUA-like domain-containing protein [Triangularia verruculosa]